MGAEEQNAQQAHELGISGRALVDGKHHRHVVTEAADLLAGPKVTSCRSRENDWYQFLRGYGRAPTAVATGARTSGRSTLLRNPTLPRRPRG